MPLVKTSKFDLKTTWLKVVFSSYEVQMACPLSALFDNTCHDHFGRPNGVLLNLFVF